MVEIFTIKKLFMEILKMNQYTLFYMLNFGMFYC